MNRHRRTMFVIIIGGAFFIAWRASSLLERYWPSPAAAKSADTAGPSPTIAGRAPARDDIDWKAVTKAQDAVELQPWGRDPFDARPFEPVVETRKPTTPEPVAAPIAPPAPSIFLTGVSRAGDRWLAAVNGGIVSVGDVLLEKYRVTAISHSTITVAADGWAFEFQLGEKTVNVRPWRDNP